MTGRASTHEIRYEAIHGGVIRQDITEVISLVGDLAAKDTIGEEPLADQGISREFIGNARVSPEANCCG